MNIYKQLNNASGVIRLLVSQLVARFPAGMLSLMILLHMEQKFHNYTAGGMALAAACVGQAIAGPVTTRWLGRWGLRPVLAAATVLCAGTLVAIALVPAHLPLYVMLAAISGFTVPPVSPSARTIYPKMVPGKLLSGLYSLDASAQEVIWAIGPVVAVITAVKISPSAALLLSAALMIGGGIWFISTPAVGSVTIPPSRRKLGAVFSRKTVRLSTAVGFLYLISFAAFEAGVVSIYGHEGLQAGLVLGINAFGSLLGGIIVGHRALNRWSLPLRMTIVFLGTTACLISLETWWLCVFAFLGGLGAAPTFAALSSLISSTVKFSETAEAFGWSTTGQLVGAAVGSALAGVFIDSSGARGAFIVASIAVLAAIVISLLGNRAIE